MTNDKILKRLRIIADLRNELRKVRDLYNESLENDASYHEVYEALTKAREALKQVKEKLHATSSIKALKDQMKELRDELKDNRDALAQDLADYYKESGLLEIEDPEGGKKRIIFSARLTDK